MRPSFKQMDYCETLHMVPLKIDGDLQWSVQHTNLNQAIGKGWLWKTKELCLSLISTKCRREFPEALSISKWCRLTHGVTDLDSFELGM